MGANEINLKTKKVNSLNVFKNYFAFMFKEHKSSIFGVLIALLGIGTLPWLMMLISSSDGDTAFGVFAIRYIDYTNAVADQNLLQISRMLMIILPFIVFNYLYDKNKMDRYWSLPISRVKLFMLNTLFIWAIVAIPTILTYYLQIVLGYLFNLAGKGIVLPTLATLVSRSLVLLTICLFPLAISIFSIMMTTSAFNGYICAVALNYIPVSMISLYESYIKNFPGYTPSLEARENSFVEFFSINGLLMRIFEDNNGVEYAWIICIYVVLALLILFISAILYKRRHVDRIGSAYMFKYFYSAIISIFVFVVLVSMFKLIVFNDFNYSLDLIDIVKDNSINIASIFAGGLIVFFIINMFMKHGRTKIFRTIIAYTLIAVLAFSTSVYGHMGIGKKLALEVPELTEIAEVKLIAYDGTFGEQEEIKDRKNAEIFEQVGLTLHFKKHLSKNPEEIAQIRDLHMKAAKQKAGFVREKQYDISEDKYAEALVKIVYYGKTGEVLMMREYFFYYDDVETLSKIFGQDIDLVPIREELERG